MTLNPADMAYDDDELRSMFSGELAQRQEPGFYLDENLLGAELVSSLAAESISLITVEQRGLVGERSDVLVLADARKLGFIFVTRDQGFEAIHHWLARISGTSHAGILLIHFQWRDSSFDIEMT